LVERLEDEEAKDIPEKAVVTDLKCAVEFVHEDFGGNIASLRSLSEHDEITFDLLWTLFPPHATLYTTDNMLKEPQIVRFLSGHYDRHQDGSQYYSMRVRFITHDGESMGWGEQNLQINGFEGAKKVHSLSCFPLASHPERDEVRAQLLQRGRRYVELVKAESTCQEYIGTGVTEDQKIILGGNYKQVKFHVSSTLPFFCRLLIYFHRRKAA
jgi:hypothetical protein